MLLRRAAESQAVHYRSPLLEAAGIPHAFATRLGGVSAPPCDTLHLGLADCSPAPGIGEDQTLASLAAPDVRENYRRLQSAIGCERHRVVWCKQVHREAVMIADQMNANEHPDADAIVTASPGLLATIRVADCVPILLAARDGRVVAAVHAGWRGVVARVLPNAIAVMTRVASVAPDEILAAVGPCISAEHFEVGPEVVEAFNNVGLASAVRPQAGAKPHIDLAAAIVTQLQSVCVPRSQIDTTDRCTFRDRDEFFSHRRDAGRTGRHAAVIATKAK